MDIDIIKIQKVLRGFLCRLKRLPLFLYILHKYLSSISYSFSVSTDDGRINSFIDENNIIEYRAKRKILFGEELTICYKSNLKFSSKYNSMIV